MNPFDDAPEEQDALRVLLGAPPDPTFVGPTEPVQRPDTWFDKSFDLILGALGLPGVPNTEARQAGEFLSAGAPLVGGLGLLAKLLPAKGRAALSAPKTGRRLFETAEGLPAKTLTGDMKEAVGNRRLAPAPGSLGNTLEMSGGDSRLKQQVVDRYGTLNEIGGRLPNKSNWEGTDEADFLEAFSGDKDDAVKYANVWGAASPNTKVLPNTNESLIARSYQLEHGGEPIPLDVARSLDPQGRQLITMAGSKVPNIGRATRGEPMSGEKVVEMGEYMQGIPGATPIDTHIMFASGSDLDKLDLDMPGIKKFLAKQLGLPTVSDQMAYDFYASNIKDALQKVVPGGGHNQVFGQTWEGAKAFKNQASEGGPKDILRALGLMKPGAMKDPKMLRAALTKAGISVPWIGMILASFYGEGGDGSS